MNGRSVGLTGMIAGVLGAILGLREVGSLLRELEARAAAFAPGPIPHGIDWIGQTAGARRLLQALDGPLVLAAWLLGALLAWRLLRLLNPGGTLLAHGADHGSGFPARLLAPLERPLVRRGFVAAFATAYLFGALRVLLQGDGPVPPPLATWGLSALAFLWPGQPFLGQALAFLLGGGLLWLMWGEWGAVTPRNERRTRLPETLRGGLLMGAAAFPVLMPLTFWGSVVIRGVLSGAGLGDYTAWNACFWSLGLGLPIGFLALGSLAHEVAGRRIPIRAPNATHDPRPTKDERPPTTEDSSEPVTMTGTPDTESRGEAGESTVGSTSSVVNGRCAPPDGGRLTRPNRDARVGSKAVLVAALATVALLGVVEAYFYLRVARGRYDYGRPLAAAVHTARRSASARTYLILTPTPRPFAGMVPLITIQGLDADHDSPQRAWSYLRQRGFQTAVADEAFVHLHDCASLRWDSTESLRVDLANLEHNPAPIFGRLLVETLSNCAPTRDNHELLRQAADAARFHQNPYWMRVLGVLHYRFGDRDKALWCLGWAGLSPREIRETLKPAQVLTTGEVGGRVLLDGSPGAGLMVGLVPANRWQTLVGRPRPFELRWIAASTLTDAEGRFRIGSLGDGDFYLTVMTDARRLPLLRRPPRVDGSPGLLHLDRAHPVQDVGTIRIRSPREPSLPEPPPGTQIT